MGTVALETAVTDSVIIALSVAAMEEAKDNDGTEDQTKFSLEQFDLVKTIGTGTFATVSLCHHKPSCRYFAMKILSLHDVIRLHQVEHVKNEKNVLKELNHPFLIPLLWSSKDSSHLYLLFPYIPGGELFSYLRKAGKFSAPTTLFFSAEIVSAFSYLHSLSIVYRDLKPENILLDMEGHVVITDFGFSKKVPDRTWTLCGTPEYLAPEIIQSKGHTKAVDWWALGVLIFEMLAGYPPFFDDNTMVIYEKILSGQIKWPRVMHTVARDLVKQLLVQDTTKRLGCMKGGTQDVMNHKFFQSLNWKDVYCRQLKPPIVPQFTCGEDTANFENYPQVDLNKVQTVSLHEIEMFNEF